MFSFFRRNFVICVVFASTIAPGLLIPAQSADWYFYVENHRKSTITRLEAKERGGNWKRFNLNGGIRGGRRVRIDWSASTNNEDCKQFLRATFADGSVSRPAMFDFCNNLDTPILFED
jgi:hypothetical protein